MGDSVATQQAKAQLALEVQAQKNQMALQQQQALQALSLDTASQKQQQQLMAALGGDSYGGGGALATKSSGNPMIDAFQQYQNQEAATNPWSIGARAIRQTALPKSDNIWENLLGNAVQGLGAGVLGQLGQNDIDAGFQEDLMPTLGKLYPSMTDVLGESPNINAGKMALIAALTDDTQNYELEKAGIKKGGKGLGGGVGDIASLEALLGMDSTAKGPGQDIFGLTGDESLKDRMNKEKIRLIGAGIADPKTVGAQIRDTYTADITGAKESAKANAEKLSQAEKMQQLADETGSLINRAKGIMGPDILSKGERASTSIFPTGLNPFASADETTALQLLRAKAADIIAAARVKGTGSVSDYEDKVYLASGVNENLTPETAEELRQRLEQVAQIRKEKAQFIDWYLTNGGSSLRADAAWDSIDKISPRYKKDSSGKVLGINPERKSLSEIIELSNARKLLKGSSPSSNSRPNPKDYSSGPAFKAAMEEWRAG